VPKTETEGKATEKKEQQPTDQLNQKTEEAAQKINEKAKQA
jgi:hypothetical protein